MSCTDEVFGKGNVWKSTERVCGLDPRDRDAPGFWVTYGYHMYVDPWKEQRYGGD